MTSKPTILIVDDDSINVILLHEGLKSDYNTIVSSTGADALLKAARYQPDLILLDMMLPDMNGKEVCRILKRENETAHIPIIFVTGTTDVDSEIEGLQLGASDYFHKPFSVPLVKVRINQQFELINQRKKLEDLAWTDGLTGISNRRLFDLRFSEACRHAERTKTNIHVMMIDIDFFKPYNDFYGHLRGDETLKLVANAINSTVNRPHDIVSRYGGEEFVVLLSEVNPASSVVIADRIKQNILDLQIPHIKSPIHEFVTVSIGVATAHDTGILLNEAEFLHMADVCLYQAKHDGRNTIVCNEYRVL